MVGNKYIFGKVYNKSKINIYLYNNYLFGQITKMTNKNAVIYKLTKLEFQTLLITNPGIIIIKFGAPWCAPCVRIEKQVHVSMDQMPNNVQNVIINIDESVELYGFLRMKKMVSSIPTILSYNQGNVSYVPDDCVVGADSKEIDLFFKRMFDHANE